jgi:hypothetical protein
MAAVTVRDALRQRLQALALVCVVTVVAALAGKMWLPTVALRLGFAAALMVVFVVAYALLARRARCPRCRHPFRLATLLRLRGTGSRPRIDQCPQCALALDTPVSGIDAHGGAADPGR